MATIKEVAKYAGVSIGTVSNVINGKKVNDKWRLPVEKAIRELNFTPHAVARSLKNNKTNDIALILPNLSDTYLSEFIMHTEKILRENEYNVRLYITNDDPENEKIVIENIQQRKFDGVILYSCQSEDSPAIGSLLNCKIPIVYFEREMSDGNCNFVGSDNCSAVEDTINYLAKQNHKRIALITSDVSKSDKTLIDGFIRSINKKELSYDESLIRIIEANKENGFKEMFSLIQIDQPPTAVILSNKKIAEGVYEAVSFNDVSIPEDLSVITISEKSWLKYNKNLQTSIERPVEEICKAVCNILLDNINSPKMYEPQKFYIKSNFAVRNSCAIAKPDSRNGKRDFYKQNIKILLLDSPAAYAIRSLLPYFRNQYNIDIEMDMLSYNELFKASENELTTKSSNYDIFMVDVPWLPFFSNTGSLLDLTEDILKDESFAKDNYIEDVFDSYCSYEGKVYGLPFMPGTQILFYRKDLFNDKDIKSDFYKIYDTELRAPKNWVEFNSIAKFFTKEFNDNSPVTYGVTMAAKSPTYVTNEFCPRKWAYNARAFDEQGNVVINSSEALNAVKNFVQSYNFAPPWAINNNWDDEINDFCTGKVAMFIQYESHSTRINTELAHELKGRIGYDIIPGGNPLLGGWSLVINNNSEKKESALEFLKWACGSDIAIPYAVLGGTTAWKSYYMSADLNLLYPWLNIAYKSYKLARKRTSPYRGGTTIIPQNAYENIMGEELKKVILKQISAEEALKSISDRLNMLPAR